MSITKIIDFINGSINLSSNNVTIQFTLDSSFPFSFHQLFSSSRIQFLSSQQILKEKQQRIPSPFFSFLVVEINSFQGHQFKSMQQHFSSPHSKHRNI